MGGRILLLASRGMADFSQKNGHLL